MTRDDEESKQRSSADIFAPGMVRRCDDRNIKCFSTSGRGSNNTQWGFSENCGLTSVGEIWRRDVRYAAKRKDADFEERSITEPVKYGRRCKSIFAVDCFVSSGEEKNSFLIASRNGKRNSDP